MRVLALAVQEGRQFGPVPVGKKLTLVSRARLGGECSPNNQLGSAHPTVTANRAVARDPVTRQFLQGWGGNTARTAFGSQMGSAFDFAGLFVVFAATHFFLDAAAFNQLPETAYSLLNRFFVSDNQFYHLRSKNPFQSVSRRDSFSLLDKAG